MTSSVDDAGLIEFLEQQAGQLHDDQAALRKAGRRLIAVLVPFAVVLLGLFRTDQAEVGDYGLIEALPVEVLVGLLVMVSVSVWASVSTDFAEWFAASSVLSLIVALSAAPGIVYDTTRFSWAFKHIGIVEYVSRTNGVDTAIDELAVYHNWPGFFVGSASLTEWLGASNAIVVASFAPVALNVLTVGALVLLLGQLCESRSTVWLATLIFFLTNWIGQDYFSPQAVAYLLYLSLLGLVLSAFGSLNGEATTGARAEKLLIVAMVLTIAASHQLTPLVLLVALGGLWLFRQVRGLWIPASAGLIVTVWALTWARDFVEGNIRDELSGVGSPLENASQTLSKAVERSDAQIWVAWAGRALFLTVGVLACVGFVLRFRRKENVLAPMALLGAPAVMLVLSFGGEILFRVALFMLRFLPCWPPKRCEASGRSTASEQPLRSF